MAEASIEGRRGASGLVSWIGWVVLSLAAGFVGALAGMPDSWYVALDKPRWTPPNWVFGPAWTLLYVLMGTAAWLVWRRRDARPEQVHAALRLFVVQLVVNAAWSPLFFGLHRPDLAFVAIVVLWVLVLVMLVVFARVRAVTILLVLPYLIWLTFAAALNASIWMRNAG